MSRSSARVQIKEFGPRLSRPNIIVGFPEVGLVGTIASSYLIEQLGLVGHGYIDSDYMPPVMMVHNSRIAYPIHIMAKDETVIVLSEVPLSAKLANEVAKEIASWAKSLKANLVIGVSGLPSRKREESQAEGKPIVLGVSNDEKSLALLKPAGAEPLEEGLVTGFYASLLKYCAIEGQPNLTLLGESMIQFPDPAAAASIIEVVSSILSIKVDTKPLIRESEEIRVKTRELMQQTQQTAQSTSAAAATYR